MTAIDTSGIETVGELRKMMAKRSIEVRITESITLKTFLAMSFSNSSNQVLVTKDVCVLHVARSSKPRCKCDGKAAPIENSGVLRPKQPLPHGS